MMNWNFVVFLSGHVLVQDCLFGLLPPESMKEKFDGTETG